jgi:hypothetical protein
MASPQFLYSYDEMAIQKSKLEASLAIAEKALREIVAISVSDCADYVRIADGIAIEAIAKLEAM